MASANGKKGALRGAGDGFGLRVAALVLAIILPLYGIILFNIADQYVEQRNEIFSNASRLARVVVDAQKNFLHSVEPVLGTVAQLREVRTQDGAACAAIFADLLRGNPHYLNVAAVTAQGDVFCSAVPPTGPVNVADRAWFRRAMETRQLSAGDFEVGKVTGKRSFTFGRPFYDEQGALAGAVYASLDLQAMGDVLQSVDVPAGTVLTEIDGNATVLARFPEIPAIIGKRVPDEPIVKNVLAGPLREGTFTASGLDRVPRFYAFSQVDPGAQSSPYVIVGLVQSLLMSQIRKTLAFNLLGLAAVTLIVILVAYEGVKLVVIRRVRDMEDVQRLRNEFLALASHQLRTPITSVRWLLELLLAGQPEPLSAAQTTLAAEAKKSADTLATLVNELIEVERGGRGVRVVPRKMNLAKVVRQAVDEHGAAVVRKKARVSWEIQDDLPKAYADPVLVRQIAANLFTNALKYSPEGGIVSIRLAREGKNVRLEVTDSGIGIPASEQSRIFERFYRASNVRELQGEGLGLGLYLAKAFVERMGGKIGFASKEGGGTTFWISLPQTKRA